MDQTAMEQDDPMPAQQQHPPESPPDVAGGSTPPEKRVDSKTDGSSPYTHQQIPSPPEHKDIQMLDVGAAEYPQATPSPPVLYSVQLSPDVDRLVLKLTRMNRPVAQPKKVIPRGRSGRGGKRRGAQKTIVKQPQQPRRPRKQQEEWTQPVLDERFWEQKKLFEQDMPVVYCGPDALKKVYVCPDITLEELSVPDSRDYFLHLPLDKCDTDYKKQRKLFEIAYYFSVADGSILKNRKRGEEGADGSGVYGEIGENLFRSVFQVIQPTKKDVFFDMGSGLGVVCAFMAMFCPEIASITGVEKAEYLHEPMEAFISHFMEKADEMDVPVCRNTRLIRGDFLEEGVEEIEKATIVFLHNTKFSEPLNRSIEQLLLRLRDHAVIISDEPIYTTPPPRVYTLDSLVPDSTAFAMHCMMEDRVLPGGNVSYCPHMKSFTYQVILLDKAEAAYDLMRDPERKGKPVRKEDIDQHPKMQKLRREHPFYKIFPYPLTVDTITPI